MGKENFTLNEEKEILLYKSTLKRICNIATDQFTEIFKNNIRCMMQQNKDRHQNMDETLLKQIDFERNILERKILKTVTPHFQNFQTFLTEILQIPQNVILPEQRIYAYQVPDSEIYQRQENIDRLSNEILRLKIMIKEYENHLGRLDTYSHLTDELQSVISKRPEPEEVIMKQTNKLSHLVHELTKKDQILFQGKK